MKKGRNLKIGLLFFILVVLFCGVQTAHADGQVLKKGSDLLSNESYEFTVKTPGYVVLDLDIKLHYFAYSHNEKLSIKLIRNIDEYPFYKEIEADTIDSFENGVQNLGSWYYAFEKKLTKGKYRIEIDNKGIHTLSVKYTITEYPSYSTYLRYLPKNVSVQAGNYKNVKYLGQPAGTRCIFKDVKVSNPNVADVYNGDSPNHFAVYGFKPGTCKVTLTLMNGKQYVVTVKVTKRDTPKLLYKSYTLYKGETFKNIIYSVSGKTTWTSSNNAVATVDSNGKVTGKGVGKCKITAKNGGKKVSCNIEVVYQWPNFDAEIWSYNTRDNYFQVKYINRSDKPLTIQAGIKVIDTDYKSFDRYVRLPKPVTIQPGKIEIVNFYVYGSTTWYDYKDFNLHYYFIFDGKQYEGHSWYIGSTFINGGKSYYTYCDEEFHSSRKWEIVR